VHREMEAADSGGGPGPPAADAHAVVTTTGHGGNGERRAGPPRLGPFPFIERLLHDLRYALRGLLRSPGFAAVAVLTLAVGVGANAAVFSLIDRLFNEPPPGLAEAEALRRLYIEMLNNPFEPGMIFPSFSYSGFSAVEASEDGAYDAVAWIPSSEETLRDGERQVSVRTSFVSHDFFTVLGVGAVRGRLFGEEEARVDLPAPVAVIAYTLWERGFGLDPEVIGRTVRLASGDFTVVGVAEEPFRGLDLSYADVFLPLGAFPGAVQQTGPWYEQTGSYLRAAIRLGPDVDDAQASERLTAGYLRRALPASDRRGIDSMEVVRTGSIIEASGLGRRSGTEDRRQAVAVSTQTIGVSSLLLLIACTNVATLLVVRAGRRRREIAVRLALGVSRSRLAFQLLVEGVVLAVAAAAAAVFVATWGGRLLRGLLLPDVRWAEPLLEPRTLAFALATATGIGLMAGLAPALQSRSIDVSSSLKAGSRAGRSPAWALRSGLIIAQAALSLVLLVGAGLFVRSFANAASLRLGFDTNQVAFVRRLESPRDSPDHAEAVAAVASRLAATPGVAGVAVAGFPPMMGYGMRGVFLRDTGASLGARPDQGASYNVVSPEFFDVVGVRIVEGRGFVRGDGDDVVVVDETMSRAYWPGRSALGECLILDRPDAPCREVVGVVEDQRMMRIIEEPTLQFFLPLEAAGLVLPQTVVMRIDAGRWNEIARVAREATYPRFSERTVRIDRMADALESQFRVWRVGAQLFVAFAVLALLITAVGVYGVMTFTVSQRTHEMGVRLALGAKLQDVVSLVIGDSVRVLGLGVALGIGGALLMGRLVEAFLYDVTPRDPASTLTASVVLLLAGVAASLIPAWRAGMADPCDALRQE
jgi:putative ABC transport system permease protein